MNVGDRIQIIPYKETKLVFNGLKGKIVRFDESPRGSVPIIEFDDPKAGKKVIPIQFLKEII